MAVLTAEQSCQDSNLGLRLTSGRSSSILWDCARAKASMIGHYTTGLLSK